MTVLSRRAEQHFDKLVQHYESLDRPEAIRNLVAAIVRAASLIDADPYGGLPAPGAYLDLAKPGRLWRKAGRYWISYRPKAMPPVITGIFYETADIPRRL